MAVRTTGHWDVLIYHCRCEHSEQLVLRLKSLIKGLEARVGEEVKVAATSEHFNVGTIFDSMEDALERCSWMFILITQDLLQDKMCEFQNSHALAESILNHAGNKYVPIYESRNSMKSLKVPTYIRTINGKCLDALEKSELESGSVVNAIKFKLIDRKDRERREAEREERRQIAEYFKQQIINIKHDFSKKKLKLKGAADVEALRKKCFEEIQRIASDKNIENLEDFLHTHEIDLSFVNQLSCTSTEDSQSKYPLLASAELSLRESGGGLHRVDVTRPISGRVPVENDEMTALAGMAAGGSESPPPYRTEETSNDRSTALLMNELKDPYGPPTPPDHRPEVVGRASPLLVPPCETEPPLIPQVVEDMQSITSFSSVPRSFAHYDQEAGSMIAECSDASVRDTASLLGSQSHANLNEFDEESMSHFSRPESPDSQADVEMDIGDNQVDLSILQLATGLRPLNSYIDGDDESMVVEVDSTAGADDLPLNDTPVATPLRAPATPPMRVMHRSICDEDDFDLVEPLDIDTDLDDVPNAGQMSPGLGELTWPRRRRGSDAGRRRPYHSNLSTNRFLSLSSIQSLSSKLSRLHQNPSLNNISEWGDRPRLLDGIRPRFSAW